MRRAFFAALEELAASDERVMLLTADLGYSFVESFARRFPRRYENVGVAEQSLLATATGLAEAGYRPFAYTIATFAMLRAFEFLRNGPVAHRLPVRLVGVGGGFEYGIAGATHHALEDVALARALPGLTIVAPVDGAQASMAMAITADCPGPVYLRLGRDDDASLPALGGRFRLGALDVLAHGDDVLIVAMGPIAIEAEAAVRTLVPHGIRAGFAVLSSIAPAPIDDLVRVLSDVRLVVTVEEHRVDGGLGSLVAEVIAERGLRCRLVRCGVGAAEAFGDRRHLLRAHGLDAAGIAAAALRAIGRGG